jgi:hypothetical protein
LDLAKLPDGRAAVLDRSASASGRLWCGFRRFVFQCGYQDRTNGPSGWWKHQIKGEKQEEKEEQRRDVHLSECRYGAFQRTFRVPEEVDTDRVEASFANGVLTVILPKTSEAAQGERKIDVKVA